jgi:hypothetical protein
VLAGVTARDPPLVTGTFPGVTRPVPPEKAKASVDPFPSRTEAGVAEKFEITAAGTTLTVAVRVTGVPAGGVTVRVYWVVAEGLTATGVPLEIGRFPGVIRPVPPENCAVRFALPPAVIVAGVAPRLVMTGTG